MSKINITTWLQVMEIQTSVLNSIDLLVGDPVMSREDIALRLLDTMEHIESINEVVRDEVFSTEVPNLRSQVGGKLDDNKG
ncbi:hypothetical protein [Evansella cellulosilytica]|uniref:Uncharacterized protein n=1 Tax=Evansella cellulosilytica (strain ATCC 21833 / DSM 2522 / FERM P-1141 / JCM 9156 / N-4) TaxID=649639 RepID=E6TVI0_EVAC2|nr:hypothetical protein [Evansella cellulosilytica]ADU30997.1 hypothetical protein Bcell_2742 [Evansella cellulosilytica DSM 2522]